MAKVRTQTLWTGKYMKDAKGHKVPVTVGVPVEAHVNAGAGVDVYLAKGFRPVEDIPPSRASKTTTRQAAEA